jgi:hypothetical protein
MQVMEELGHFQLPCDVGPCIIMLKHEVVAAMNGMNGPQDHFTVSLCIQIAIDKMQLCLSVAFVCPYPHHGILSSQH